MHPPPPPDCMSKTRKLIKLLVNLIKENYLMCTLPEPDKSAIAEHAIGENHHIDFDESKVLTTEDRFWPRKSRKLYS